ncbi:bifunctional riboflavin kinase/FAD synthetase [Arenicella xantha]|uniref:Riboflavin biosynthesis protein n=1 Tax=Arenicella xantha TaxID=644221 RepID=A0A395JLZ3_9GAMM|nr:bifunctional riboflavin kinase/FAD synthetase [Arenicella xantha]RBP52664.1 FMN adenylyltransferase /riboflavin kinase [Arenicella xantha]
MELITGIDKIEDRHAPSVVSIGNYDGVHRGHQFVIKTLIAHSQRLQAPATVITFEPLAKEFFAPGSVERITTIEERAQRLFELGVERVLCIPFDTDFAAYSPEGFVNDVLLDGLGVRHVCVGDDFRFGKARAGDFDLLQRIGRDAGFEVSAHETFELAGCRVSSGRIRTALIAGDFELAERLLGRPYTIQGKVQVGQQLGRTLAFPTANIVLPEMVLPVDGVYAVSTRVQGAEVAGVANVGRRPTVDGKENRLEVHLFDFDADIYGQNIEVRFVAKLREEVRFDSVDQLKAQIQRDARAARKIFAEMR